MKKTARIFEESDGFHWSCATLDYLDARGRSYRSRAAAARAAFRSGYTHVIRDGVCRVIPVKESL